MTNEKDELRTAVIELNEKVEQKEAIICFQEFRVRESKRQLEAESKSHQETKQALETALQKIYSLEKLLTVSQITTKPDESSMVQHLIEIFELEN